MQINIQAKNIDLTEVIKEYVSKKVSGLEKFIRKTEEDIVIAVEVGKTTNHHKKGEVFRAEISFLFSGNKFYAFSEMEDLYTAVDDVKEQIERQLVGTKDRGDTLYRRGARSVKKMMKGLSKRNPFTSKY